MNTALIEKKEKELGISMAGSHSANYSGENVDVSMNYSDQSGFAASGSIEGVDLSYSDKDGVSASGSFEGVDLSYSDQDGFAASGSFEGVDLSYSNQDGVTASGSFEGVDLSYSDQSGFAASGSIEGVDLSYSDKDGVSASGSFEGVDLSYSDKDGVSASGSFDGIDLSYSDQDGFSGSASYDDNTLGYNDKDGLSVNGVDKSTVLSIVDTGKQIVKTVTQNPIATATGGAAAAGGAAALLGAYYAISGRRREDDDSATLINRDDGEGAGDGLEGGLENGSTGSPTGEPANVGEGTGTPIEPVIIGGNTTAPEGVTEREGNSDTEDLPDDNFYVWENIKLLQNYYYATTKEQAGELLSDICKKDPANTDKYIDALSEAVQSWNSCDSYEEQMEKYGRPAEEIMLENYSEYREPEVSAISQHIQGNSQFPSLTDKNKTLLTTLYFTTNKNDAEALLKEIITSDPDNKSEYENYFQKLQTDVEKYSQIKGLDAALENMGKEYNSLDDYKYEEEVQNDPERKSALFQMFLRRNKLEIGVEEKRKLFEEKKANGDVISTKLTSTKFKYDELSDEQKANNCINPGSAERDNFEKNMEDSLNSLCESYWFEIVDGNITIHEIEGVEETKPKAKELLKENFIKREELNKNSKEDLSLEFGFGETKDGKPAGGWTIHPKTADNKPKSSTIIMHQNFSLYNPMTDFSNISSGKIIEAKYVDMEYSDHNITLAHELIHSLRNLKGSNIDPPRNDNKDLTYAYPGKIKYIITHFQGG